MISIAAKGLELVEQCLRKHHNSRSLDVMRYLCKLKRILLAHQVALTLNLL